MPRSNPQVDSCNRTIDSLRKQIERMRQDPPDIPFAGCGDSSCITTHGLGGMHTNGGCRCDERALRRAVIYWRDVAVRRQVAIQDMLLGGGEDAHGKRSETATSACEGCRFERESDVLIERSGHTCRGDSKWRCRECGSHQAHDTGFGPGLSTWPACAKCAAEHPRPSPTGSTRK